MNLARPRAKAKYSSMTDSAQVLRRKVEKNPYKGSEIGPETVSLQTVENLCPDFGQGMVDRVPFA